MATKSLYPSINIPEISIWEFLFEHNIPFPQNKVIYVDPKPKGREYTFHDVKNTAIAFGQALRTQWDWQKGDVIGIFSPNCIDYPPLTFGTLWAHGVVSPANPAYSAAEVAFQLSNSGAKAILTQANLLDTAFEATRIAGIPRHRILIMGDETDKRAVHFNDFIKFTSSSRPARKPQSPSDLAFIPYSSGTTGLPKGVMITQRNIVSDLSMMDITQAALTWDGGVNNDGDTVVAVLPFYHIYGLAMLVLHTIHRGLRTVVLPAFKPESFLQTIQEYKATYAYVVPPILLILSKSPIVEKYNLRSIRAFMSAAAPLTPDLVLDVFKRLKIPVVQAYGLTETSPGSHMLKIEDWQTAVGSVGRLLPNMTAKYVSESGEALPPGSVGELWLKGPNVFAGYWKNPAATANAMTSDGYFQTGDIGYQDKDGNFYITDRLKELIKYKGFQVAPAELEGLLVGYEKVADVCVVGVHDQSQATELPMAFVVKALAFKHIDDQVLEKDIIGWLDSRVAGYKRLRGGIKFVDEIPKSAAGKILRRVLKDQIKAEVEKRETKSKL